MAGWGRPGGAPLEALRVRGGGRRDDKNWTLLHRQRVDDFDGRLVANLASVLAGVGLLDAVDQQIVSLQLEARVLQDLKVSRVEDRGERLLPKNHIGACMGRRQEWLGLGHDLRLRGACDLAWSGGGWQARLPSRLRRLTQVLDCARKCNGASFMSGDLLRRGHDLRVISGRRFV